MRLKQPIFTIVALLATTSSLAATEVREILGRQYVQEGNHWYQRDDAGQQFRVDPNVITIKFRQGAQRGAQESLHESVGGDPIRQALTGFIDIELDRNVEIFTAIDAYMASGLVEIAEPNTFGEYLIVPDDTQYPSQWHLPIMDAEEAWDITQGGPGAIVAILDSGTEFTHEDLGTGSDAYQNIWLNSAEDAWGDPNNPSTGNGIDDDMNGYVDDWKGYDFGSGNNNIGGSFFHGTAVAGATGAKTNNARGVAGMAGGWNSAGTRLMIAGVGDSAPVGSILDDAILYASAEGANVVQLSLSVGQSAAIDAAIQMAQDNNVTIICASGNGSATSIGYPSSNTHVISVGATDSSDMKASFSNHGPDLDISAPGVNILMPTLGNNYATSSGTSFSAPLTSGVVALMLTANPNLTNTEIRQILRDTADKVGGYNYDWNGTMPGHSFELGYGRVNAHSAVLASNTGSIFADGFESGNVTAWTTSSP